LRKRRANYRLLISGREVNLSALLIDGVRQSKGKRSTAGRWAALTHELFAARAVMVLGGRLFFSLLIKLAASDFEHDKEKRGVDVPDRLPQAYFSTNINSP
jgi:hypothetical protein